MEGEGACGVRWLLGAWVFGGMLVFTRVLFLILLPGFVVVYVAAMMARKTVNKAVLAGVIMPPVVIVGLVAWINEVKFGSPFLTGYHQWHPEQHLPVGSELDGALGMLFSNHWSMFVYFPVLIIALPGVRRFCREHPWDAGLIYSMFFTMFLLLGKIPWWRGEWTYGPRYMLFILPVAALPALMVAQEVAGRLPRRSALAALAAMAGVLGISTWLQFQVNRAPFFFVYEVEALLDKHVNRDVAEYLFERHEALIYDDLYAGRDNLDQTRLFQLIDEQSLLTPPELDHFRERLRELLRRQNFYWWG
jgi:hypothetical protein